MDSGALLLSRIQFALTISFHIIFPSLSIGLAAWLTVLEGLRLATGREIYRGLFEFWLKIFGVIFGLGVVSGIVMAFQFGTNWSTLSRMSGPIQGPLLAYETFTAFYLEASFFGILIFGRSRVPPWFYLFSTAMVALGTAMSAFWILANNSWMQVPIGYGMQNGVFAPTDWSKIIFNRVLWVRFPHMLLASFITGTFCVAATGAWYVLRHDFTDEARVMLRMGLYLAAVVVPLQLLFGHLNGEYVLHHQPSKMAAIEARWHDETPASEVLIAWPDVGKRRNRFAITLPAPLGSLIDSDSLSAGEVGLDSIARENWPPIAIPFFSFRIMVGCGLILLALAWLGSWLNHRGRLERNRTLLWLIFLSFPLPFVAILTGWFTAEVGRQPWAIYGLLRTAQAVTPVLRANTAATSLIVYCLTYSFIFTFGTVYIHHLLRVGPIGRLTMPQADAMPRRPMSLAEPLAAPQLDLSTATPSATPTHFKK